MPSRTEEIVEVWTRLGGNISATSREVGVTRSTVRAHLAKSGLGGKALVSGRIKASAPERRRVPKSGVRRYILTSAQNNTYVNAPVLQNLEALAEHYDAELMISRYSYNKASYGRKSTKPDRGPTSEDLEELWYDPAIEKYASDNQVELCPGLVWCGEMNILPTATRPLSGLETYTGRRSGIFPHAKIAMESVASGKHEGTKFNYTTGTVTQRNYIQKKAGLRAEHEHCYGGLLVEIDSDGDWFCRHLNATERGEIYDLTLRAWDGEVTDGHEVEAITWGDAHVAQLDPTVCDLAWSEGGMLDQLRPRYQFIHDIFDMRARNHHERGDPHRMFERYVAGEDSVEGEVKKTADFLHHIRRTWSKTVVVNSNHDNALEKWLREADYRHDPRNAVYFLTLQLEKYRSLQEGRSNWMLLEWAIREARGPRDAKFLREDESFVICPDASGGIECGMHGHLGTNGARGTPRNLSRLGRKANTGHTHTASIVDGMYVAGGSCKLDMGFNVGPSAWSHSHVVTYKNGKRCIVTMWNGKWRAT